MAARLTSRLALALAIVAAPALAQGQNDLNGFWELRDDSKLKGDAPQLVPDVAAVVKQRGAQRAAELAKGVLFNPTMAICVNRGNFGVLGDSAPTMIIQSSKMTTMFFESTGAPRHIYTDGRAWPDPAKLEASTTGYSIGHWEGDTFVIETRGLDPRHGQVPGGAISLQTRVTERWHKIENGEKLQMDVTVEDPTIFITPYKFTWVYYRDPPETYAAELICDASDPKQVGSAEMPPQQ